MIELFLIVLGLCLGSFVSALTWRLHASSELERKTSHKSKPQPLTAKELSLLKGRSMCPACYHKLAPLDLVPVLSWIWLKGKCHYCGQSISWQYPLMELALAALFVISYVWWPLALHGVGLMEFVVWLLLLTGLLALVVYDLRWFILPDRIIYPFITLMLAQLLIVTSFYHGGWSALLGGLWGVLVLAGLFYGLFQLSRGKWIGGGDVKLGVLLGLTVGGPLMSVLLLFVASITGSVVALPLLTSGKLKRSSRLPFGPFLVLGAILVRLFGASLIAWYKRQL